MNLNWARRPQISSDNSHDARVNHLSEVRLSSFKTSSAFYPHISPIAQRKHICIFTKALCASMGYLW